MWNACRVAMLAAVAFRCLIVDDNAEFLHAARALLQRQQVTVLGVASSGREALERAHELRPDVVLVDLDLDGELGIDLAERLARVPELAGVRIVLMSTYAEGDVAELVATSPAAGFLSKSALSARAIEALVSDERLD